jgi:predicted anti-sigma-YlaC factor YlaD
MTCRKVCGLLQPLLEGDLREPKARRVEAHLVSCAACRREAELLRTLDRALAEEPVLLPPPELPERIIRAAALRAVQRRLRPTPVWLEITTFLGVALTAGAATWVGASAVARAAGIAVGAWGITLTIALTVSAALAGASVRYYQS